MSEKALVCLRNADGSFKGISVHFGDLEDCGKELLKLKTPEQAETLIRGGSRQSINRQENETGTVLTMGSAQVLFDTLKDRTDAFCYIYDVRYPDAPWTVSDVGFDPAHRSFYPAGLDENLRGDDLAGRVAAFEDLISGRRAKLDSNRIWSLMQPAPEGVEPIEIKFCKPQAGGSDESSLGGWCAADYYLPHETVRRFRIEFEVPLIRVQTGDHIFNVTPGTPEITVRDFEGTRHDDVAETVQSIMIEGPQTDEEREMLKVFRKAVDAILQDPQIQERCAELKPVSVSAELEADDQKVEALVAGYDQEYGFEHDAPDAGRENGKAESQDQKSGLSR